MAAGGAEGCRRLSAVVDAFQDLRSRRRWVGPSVLRGRREGGAKGGDVSEAQLAREMKERDERDSTRADAPLAQAPDAFYLDSTPFNLDEVEEAVLKIVRGRVSNGKDFN